ncbi:MAG TPA: DCC1-like thiol-disulfide oxidoreductase family protein, partial [Vicinamibacterales bacterium]|nr:DCC1-like thiol-disulfide oxidoreductase family protein [Vicinamibacterales bacterium]
VRFIARHDPSARFCFCASQSVRGAQWLGEHRLTHVAPHSLVLIDDEGRASVRSTAALRIAAELTLPWRMLGLLLLVPRPVRDAVYRIVAASRHRILRRADRCELMPRELRSRIIG